MTGITRRRWLCGATALALAPHSFAGVPRSTPESLESLANRLRSAERDQALELAAKALHAGTTPTTVLGAVVKIGAEDVRPRPHGILHTVMMVNSSLSLLEGANAEEAALTALWNLDDLKVAQERDRNESGDWSMPPRPPVKPSSSEAARKELFAAMDAWDPDRADRAVVGWLSHVDQATFFEAVWPWAVRCHAFIGHKVIYAAQLDRALRKLPPTLLETAARSLVRTLLVDRETDAWAASREAARRIPTGAAHQPRAERALELYRELRTKDSDATSSAIEALLENHAAEDLWNAARLVASEVFHDRSGRRSNTGREALLPVHTVTVVEALGHVARTTRDPLVARACLIEALKRLPAMRAWLIDTGVLETRRPALEELGREVAGGTIDLEAALRAGSPAQLRAHLEHGTTSVDLLADRLRTSLLTTAREHHQHKYLAAVLAEARSTAPELRPLLLAPAVDYVAHPEDDATKLHERSLEALRRG